MDEHASDHPTAKWAVTGRSGPPPKTSTESTGTAASPTINTPTPRLSSNTAQQPNTTARSSPLGHAVWMVVPTVISIQHTLAASTHRRTSRDGAPSRASNSSSALAKPTTPRLIRSLADSALESRPIAFTTHTPSSRDRYVRDANTRPASTPFIAANLLRLGCEGLESKSNATASRAGLVHCLESNRRSVFCHC